MPLCYSNNPLQSLIFEAYLTSRLKNERSTLRSYTSPSRLPLAQPSTSRLASSRSRLPMLQLCLRAFKFDTGKAPRSFVSQMSHLLYVQTNWWKAFRLMTLASVSNQMQCGAGSMAFGYDTHRIWPGLFVFQRGYLDLGCVYRLAVVWIDAFA